MSSDADTFKIGDERNHYVRNDRRGSVERRTDRRMSQSIIIWMVVLGTGLCLSSHSRAQGGNPSPVRLNVGFSKTVFPELNERDAKAAIKIWTQDIIDDEDFNYEGSFTIYADDQALITAMMEGHINTAPLPPIEFIRLSRDFTLYPAICAKFGDTVLNRFLLLVRKDSGFRTVQDLRDGTLVMKQESPHSVLEVWLDVLLQEAGLPEPDVFFGQVIQKEREFQLIFPLLLKQADCCIVTESSFMTMSELNPQLNIQLTTLQASDSLSFSNILVFTDQLDEETRNDVTSLALDWGESQTTDQLQILFRFNALLPYEAGYFENTRLLLEKYSRFHEIDR